MEGKNRTKGFHVPKRVLRDLTGYAKIHSIEKVILFGSRARGNHTDRSDIDIALKGGDFDAFERDIKEKTHSLLMFDVVDLNKHISDDLMAEIARDGVVIYEKNR
ncbi:MAG: nucleotidyltransferase domain-containing protein [Lachnospiraceae bacterium]|nr:nucleotidyltransferase domain-containing protein [Lachnospiraceae bacterium]